MPAEPLVPSRHDSDTIPCPICRNPFTPNGRRRYCSDPCRAAAYRRRQPDIPTPTLPPAQPRRPVTVYECDNCGQRSLGHQRCDDCGTFMRRLGYGGHCPHCDEPVAIDDLLNQHTPTHDK